MSTPYQFPAWAAGQDITAATLTEMEPQFVVTPVTTTRASTTAQVADPYLSFNVNAGGVYLIEFSVGYSGLIAAAMAVTWLVPVGTSGYRHITGPGSSASDPNADNLAVRQGTHNFSTVIIYGCARNSATLWEHFYETSAFTAGSAGTVSLAWAQNTSNAAGNTVQVGSWGRCTELQ